MISFILKRFSGSHYKRFYKKCRPRVERINALEREYQQLSDEQLRAKTDEFRQRYQAGENLDDLLPEAFAAVKNAARRLCGRMLMVRGQELEWQMVHYDVQLIGGMALHENMVAEMATGEGKTLVATLPLYLNALTGRNCQLVTVNEYLALRDSEWMGYLFNFLGLSVGCIRGSHAQSPAEKREQYLKDITYGTASEFGFDYLRDNGMATRAEDQVQRDHYFCIVDEVDSILIDEARTPLIISGPSQDGDLGESYRNLKPLIERLFKEQSRLVNRLVGDARDILRKDQRSPEEELEALSKLLQVKLGNPKNKILQRLMEEGGVRKKFDAYDLEMMGDFNKEKRYWLKEDLFYTIDEKHHNADLTEKGRNFLRPNDEESFLLPDLPTTYMEIDKDNSLEQKEKDQKKLAAQQQFERISAEIHTISQLLRAYSLYERDVQYVVQDGKVLIVDENTGRVMPGRRWSEGLHQAVEAKEGVAIEKETKTYATITLQNYFRLYDKLAGMTGTAETEANEFMDIYNMRVMVVPTNKPCIREDNNDIIYKTRREKFNAAIDEIEAAHKRSQPCLVGTVSVESSELLSRMLRRKNIPHSVLNAKQHQQEAEIVARAGAPGAVTIATNMAGRGTDIKLAPGIADKGGLFVIGTERHTSRRIDRQLRGRSARQGDPGRSKFFLSLEDDLMRLYSNQGFAGKMLESSFEEGEPLEHKWLNPAIERAQKTVEQHHYSTRKRLLQYDDVLNKQREVIYELRNAAIHSEEPRQTIFELIEEEVNHRVEDAGIPEDRAPAEENLETFLSWARSHFPISLPIDEVRSHKAEELARVTIDKIREAYATKENAENPEALRQLERYVIINTIDRHWQSHLTEMEDLRQSVSLRGYGQKDPLQEYKSEAFAFFEQLMGNIRGDICSGIFRSATSVKAFENMIAMIARARQSGPAGTENAPKPGGRPAPASNATGSAPKREIHLPKVRPEPVKSAPEPGRNETVIIQRGTQTQEMKWKKAKNLVEKEGWQLLSTSK